MQSPKSNTRLIGSIAITFALCWLCTIFMIYDAYYIDRQNYSVECPWAPAIAPPAYQSKMFRGVSYVSLQLPIDPIDNTTKQDIAGQTKLAMENLKEVITSTGGFLKNVLKCTVVMQNLTQFQEMTKTYQQYFEEDNRPAMTLIQSDLPKIGKVQALMAIEAYVALP